ncbi:unannotated protein [freshwater metagenome]|uniref:Unannotated protein n=1 Tax=freshwater metagenome TaxID=449393 RepID=A0A6J7EYT4_9ZZZZ
MRQPVPPMHALLKQAGVQPGVFTTSLALETGVTKAQLTTALRRGTIQQPHSGVFRVSGSPWSWEQEVMIAVSLLRGVASHRCAARLHGLDGFADAPVEITMAHSGSRRPRSFLAHRSRLFNLMKPVQIKAIPTTTVAHTLVDLGAVVSDDKVEQALDDSIRKGFNLRWITETLEQLRRPGVTGCGALLRVLARPDRRGPIPDSTFERLVQRVICSKGLGKPERQVLVRCQGQRKGYSIDVAWPEFKLGLEADSELWHWGPRRGRLARQRHNRLTAHGWEMIYASWQDLDDPSELIKQLKLALQRHWVATGSICDPCATQ